jgi:hypothetical protein
MMSYEREDKIALTLFPAGSETRSPAVFFLFFIYFCYWQEYRYQTSLQTRGKQNLIRLISRPVCFIHFHSQHYFWNV